MIPIKDAIVSIPSILYLSNTECLIGTEALDRQKIGEFVVHEVKRFLGKTLQIPENTEQKEEELEIRSNFDNLVEMENGLIGVEIVRKATREHVRSSIQLLPEQISSLVLLRLKYAIEKKYPGRPIRATVGVPAVFGDEQRTATLNAIKMAGIDLIELVNEPTAAAKEYIDILKKSEEFIQEDKERNEMFKLANEHPEEYDLPKNRNIFVYDFGGGTLDISIIDMDTNKVVGTYGNPLLGGNNLDRNVTNWLLERIQHELDEIGMEDDKIEMLLKKKRGLIQEAAEKMKINLSKEFQKRQMLAETQIDLDFLDDEYVTEYYDGEIILTYQKFLELNEKEFMMCQQLMKNALNRSGLSKDDIYKVVMVGGSCKCPKIKEMLIQYFGNKKVDQNNSDYDLMVSKGLALYAQSVNTSIQAYGERFGDVISKTLSIELSDHEGESLESIPLIERNCSIPYSKTITVVNSVDQQPIFPIKILQEGREFMYFEIEKIPRLRKGQVEVELTFEVKADGMLHVYSEIVVPKIGKKKEEISKTNPVIYNVNEEQMNKRGEIIKKLFQMSYK